MALSTLKYAHLFPVSRRPVTPTASAVLARWLSALGVQSVTNGFLWGLLNQSRPRRLQPMGQSPAHRNA